MFRRLLVSLATLLFSTALFAQSAPSDVEQRLRALEERVAAMQKAAPTVDFSEIQREIDVLSKEIETLKAGGEKKVASADVTSAGLGAAASKIYRTQSGLAFGGYGEFLYQNFDAPGRASTADALRAILYTGYKFNDRVLFNSEIEYEHANTERTGEVEVEFAYLDFLVRPEMNVRAGLLLMPVGLTNENHEPTAYIGARRPIVDSRIIPTTWMELGGGVYGDVGTVTYRGYVTTGFNSTAFTATGIRGGRQLGSQAKADDLSVVGRVDWHPIEGAMVGGSLYTGGSGQEQSFTGRVTIAEGHAQARLRGFDLRALYARGTIGDAAAINAQNKLVGAASVGERFGGWYVEGAYDVLGLFGNRGERSLSPYARIERLNTQQRVPAGFLVNRANDQKIFTLGLAFKPMSQTVVKVDWQKVDNRANTGVDQFNVALGYIF